MQLTTMESGSVPLQESSYDPDNSEGNQLFRVPQAVDSENFIEIHPQSFNSSHKSHTHNHTNWLDSLN